MAERHSGEMGGRTCKRELTDHVAVLSEDHLRRLLSDYVAYYGADRIHTRLADAPDGRPVEVRPSTEAKVIGFPRVGGLYHRYAWKGAAWVPKSTQFSANDGGG